MIVLFTDFGPMGPYTGQMEAVLLQHAPQAPIIHLVNNAPAANPRLSSYLLSALRLSFPDNAVFLCVVDPGVGSERKPVVLWADGQYFVGPDNGLLNTVAKHARQKRWWLIDRQPENCSISFHGRDIFAPIAARLATGAAAPYLRVIDTPNLAQWPEDLSEVIYIDGYGNAMTGLRYRADLQGRGLMVKNHIIKQAETFSSVPTDTPFWYQNSSGLVEIAVNQGSAGRQLGLSLGMTWKWLDE
ncbi:MAG: hypothetical protein CVV13_13920 [Gammaproteobacteria bacterium HGW-Gammaproteobacteria-3]|nr:MAG: hypothetical protein CVV13_13920 [Gammaproteobacteria bacterium HGW-Gammaproteobacteria-3]